MHCQRYWEKRSAAKTLRAQKNAEEKEEVEQMENQTEMELLRCRLDKANEGFAR